jgi:hypothetical protein
MHHISLCTSCIALFNCGHLLHIRVDHAEPEVPQVSCCEDTNIIVIEASLGASHPIPDFYFLINIFMLRNDCALG